MASLLTELARIDARKNGTNLLEDSDLAFRQELEAIDNRRNLREARERANANPNSAAPNEFVKKLGDFGLGLAHYAGRGIISPAQLLLSFAGRNLDLDTITNKSNESFRNMLVSQGIPEEDIDAALTGESLATSTGKWLSEKGYNWDTAFDDTYKQWAGDNPTFWDETMHGVGTSMGSVLSTLALNGLLGFSPAAAGAVTGLSEATSEAGSQLSKNYMKDKGRWNDALEASMYNMMLNAPTDMILDALEGAANPLLGGSGNYLKRALTSAGVNVLAENIQELKQEILGQGTENTFDNGVVNPLTYAQNVWEEAKKTPEYFKQIAPSITASTLITSGILGLAGLGGGNAKQNANNANVNNEELEKLQADQATLKEQLNNAKTPEEINNILVRLSNVNKAIENFGKSKEQVVAEGQATAAANVIQEANNTAAAEAIQGQGLPEELLTPLNNEITRLQDIIDTARVDPNYFADEQKQAEISELALQANNIQDIINNGNIEAARGLLGQLGVEINAPTNVNTTTEPEMPVNNAPVTPFESETPVNNTPAPETQTTPEQEKNNSDSNEETLRQNAKRQILEVMNDEEYADAVSHAFIAGNKYFAKYSDNTLEDVINSDNLKFEKQDYIFIRDENGQIVFDNHNKPKEAKAQTEFNELGALIRVSRLADKSSIMHELGHLFLHKFQALSKAGKLSGIAKQDFETLLKTYGVSDLDTATHERFATDLERYLWTGEASNAKLKRVFEQFKRWLRSVYNSLKDIKYVGNDGREHSVELTPEIKEIFDHMFNSEELGVKSKKGNKKARKNKTNTNDTTLGFGDIEEYDVKKANAETKRKNEEEFERKFHEAPKSLEVEDAPEIAKDIVTPFDTGTPSDRNKARVITPRGTKLDIRYRVVEAGDLITSNNDDFSINKDYPQELQNRDRSNYANKEQVEEIAKNLVPELVADNPLASNGAPIVDSNLVVEAGNGRTMGIRRAYNKNTKRAAEYKSWVIENAAKFGLNPDYVAKLERPVLVRERISEIDKGQFISEANESSIAGMSATEQAIEDAKKLDVKMLRGYDINKSFDDNTRFMFNFIQVIGGNDKGQLMTKGGSLSVAGVERIQNALAAKAYKDPKLMARLSENLDDDVKILSNALKIASPEMAILQAQIDEGKLKADYSIAEDLIKAIDRYANYKGRKMTAGDIRADLMTYDMFSENRIPEIEKKILLFFTDNYRSSKRIAQGLAKYAIGAINSDRIISFDPDAKSKLVIMSEAFYVPEENGNASEGETYSQAVIANDEEKGIYNGLKLPFNPKELRTESGRSIGEAEKSELLLTPEGSPNLGSVPEINENFPAGVIHANAGAVQRSERIHGKDIRAKHYDKAETLLLDVLNNYTTIYPGDDNSSIFLTIQGDSKHLAKSVITRIKAENGLYKVKDMGITKTRNFENKTPLYTRSTSPVIDSDSNLAISSHNRTKSEGRELNARQSNGNNKSVPSNGENVKGDNGNRAELYNQILGEKGAAELDKAEGNTYRMDNLKTAKEMTDAGKDAKTIRLATGWEKGIDGK